MKIKDGSYLLAVGVAGIMSYFGNAMAEDTPTTKPAEIPAPATQSTIPTTAPEATLPKSASWYDNIKQRLEHAFKESGECDKVYWVNFSEEDVLVCDEEDDGERRQKYGINLGQICDVRLQENYRWYIFEWLGGDDVVVGDKGGSWYTLRLWDKSAVDIYHVLGEYIDKNVPKEERCSESNSVRKSGAEGLSLIRINN